MKEFRYFSQSGFTLIEMVAALAVVAVGVAAAISWTASMGLNAARLEEKAFAQWLMANAYVQIRLEQYEAFNSSPLESSSSIDMGGRDWYVFSQNTPAEFPNSVLTTINVCTDQQQENCILEQTVYSSARVINQ